MLHSSLGGGQLSRVMQQLALVEEKLSLTASLDALLAQQTQQQPQQQLY